MRTLSLALLLLLIVISCKSEPKTVTLEVEDLQAETIVEKDSIVIEVIEPIVKTSKQIKDELTSMVWMFT